jgi:hypothetical protein
MLGPEALHALIRAKLVRAKLADGRLPHDSIPRVWGGPGNGEKCVACEELITKNDFVMDGIGEGSRAFQFHVQCFRIWDSERNAPER